MLNSHDRTERINHPCCVYRPGKFIFRGRGDWSASHPLLHAHINLGALCRFFKLEQTAACRRETDRDKIASVTMDRTSCLSWCAAAGWGMTVSWQSILSALTTGSHDLWEYDLSRQLNKHVSHTGALSNVKTCTRRRDKQQIVWFGHLWKKLPGLWSLPAAGG